MPYPESIIYRRENGPGARPSIIGRYIEAPGNYFYQDINQPRRVITYKRAWRIIARLERRQQKQQKQTRPADLFSW